MANPQNLKVPTSSEARKNGRKGGIKSGEVRRKQKTFKERIKWMLEMNVEVGKLTKDSKIKSLRDIPGANLQVMDQIIAQMIKKALQGDTKAVEFIRDTIGENPIQKIEQTTVSAETIDKVEKLMKQETK